MKQEKDQWEQLYEAAKKVQNGREISPFLEAGGVAAALLTQAGNIYVGVCIDSACSMGMCAERNAMANMITHGESKICKILALMSDGKAGPPCGVCREFMMQLDKDSGNIEILMDYESRTTVRLKELLPDWRGSERFADKH
ncbi:MAG: cytidine deaminase family protein [Negativibacillus sp.]